MTVYPEEGNFPAVARALLDAADHPYQVVSVSHPQAGFMVPEEVFERFQAAGTTEDSDATQQAPADEQPRRRRPGRPRKPLLSPEELKAAIAEGTPEKNPDASKEE